MSKNFQNIGVLAHVDAGKTTLTEQMLYLMGAVRSLGSVDAGSTTTDSLAVERERGISVRTSTASGAWNGVTINLIDTPGHVDFAGEVERSLAALDFAVVVISAVEGIRAHTENILHALDQAKLRELLRRSGSPTFFSEELMTNYFSFRRGKEIRFVLFDNAESLSRKLRLADSMGIREAFLHYPAVRAFLPKIRV